MRLLRLLACGAAVALAGGAQSPEPSSTLPPLEAGPFTSGTFTPAPIMAPRGPRGRDIPYRPQRSTVTLAVRDNAFAVEVFSFGRPFVVDPGKLRLTVRNLDKAGARPVPFAADAGAPVLDRSFTQAQPPGTMTVFHVPVTFRMRPPQPGMYDVALESGAGFTRFADGAELPLERPSASHWNVYWPDERDGDRGLRAARTELAGKTAYGYGGFTLSCGAASFKIYLADAGFHVRRVEREHGVVERQWTGSTVSWGNDAAYWFFAVDPLAIHADYPSANAFGTGGSSQPAGDAPCPGMTLADPWHVAVTLTTVPPPRLPAGYDQAKIAVGMSRADVRWRRGYPQGYFTREALDAKDVWSYFPAIPDSYELTFRDDRLVSFTTPRGLP
jgi:hypothetical protein